MRNVEIASLAERCIQCIRCSTAEKKTIENTQQYKDSELRGSSKYIYINFNLSFFWGGWGGVACFKLGRFWQS